jgi:lactate permease
MWMKPTLPWEGHLLASTAIAAVPMLFMFWALTVKRMKGYLAAIGTLGIGILIALIFYRMPIQLVVMSMISGGVFAFMPIIWIIVPAFWLYQLSVKSGYFQTMTSSIVSLTKDMRIQVLLVAYLLGSFLEGTAGFGIPVAICAALLVGIGFPPLKAAVICLLANTAAVAFAGVGIPILALEGATGFPAKDISRSVALLLPFLTATIPFLIVGVASGFRKIGEVLPAILVVSVSYTISVYLTSTYLGPELPALLGAFVSAISLALWLRVWKPRNVLSFDPSEDSGDKEILPSLRDIVRAWLPFIILTVLVFLWGIPSVKEALSGTYKGTLSFLQWINEGGRLLSFHPKVPFLHGSVIEASGQPMDAYWKLEILGLAGTAVWIVCFLSKWLYRMKWTDMGSSFTLTLNKLKWSMVTIIAITGYAYLSNFSGMSGTLGQAFAMTGSGFPFLSPVLGWIGVFITGSDTSANLLFGPLQSVTAQAVGMDPLLALAANTIGGGTAKMVSMQSITIAAAAVGLAGKESDMLRKTLIYSIGLLLLISIVTYLL